MFSMRMRMVMRRRRSKMRRRGAVMVVRRRRRRSMMMVVRGRPSMRMRRGSMVMMRGWRRVTIRIRIGPSGRLHGLPLLLLAPSTLSGIVVVLLRLKHNVLVFLVVGIKARLAEIVVVLIQRVVPQPNYGPDTTAIAGMPIMHKRRIQLLRIGNQTFGTPRLTPGLLHILHLFNDALHNLIGDDCCVDADIAGTRKRSRIATAVTRRRRRRFIASITRGLNGLNKLGNHGHNRLQKRLQSHRGNQIMIRGTTKRRGATATATALTLSLLLNRCCPLIIRTATALDNGGKPENIAAHMLPRFEELRTRAHGDHISIVIGVGKDHLRKFVTVLGRKAGVFDAQKVLGEGKEFLVRELVLVVQEALYWDPTDFRSIAELDDAVGGWAPKVGSGGRVGIR
mmetsp:Transcript_13859/g.20561  ORF Transcript_13859/g.20561 Transcript_13859/m.20561 type:complete len:396 (+) Transcript_13859:781-1968(+)